MKEKTFMETMAPRLGQGLGPSVNSAQLTAVWELLIRKGIFTREELTAEVELQLGKLSDVISKTPIPSPIQRNTRM
jgi:hypothetical protein